MVGSLHLNGGFYSLSEVQYCILDKLNLQTAIKAIVKNRTGNLTGESVGSDFYLPDR